MGIDLVTLTRFLAPLLPYLVKGSEEATREAGKKFGAGVWDTAIRVWQMLKPKVESKEASREAVSDLVSAPEDPDFQTAFRLQLKKLLEKDKSLAKEIVQIMNEQSSKDDSSVPNIELQGDVRQEAGDYSILIGHIGSAGTINL